MNESPLLSVEEIQLCEKKMGANNQIAFGIMLAHFKLYITFPSAKEKPLPLKLISQVSTELG